jgi:hypothetical protein
MDTHVLINLGLAALLVAALVDVSVGVVRALVTRVAR